MEWATNMMKTNKGAYQKNMVKTKKGACQKHGENKEVGMSKNVAKDE